MIIELFQTEAFFNLYEFNTPYLLCVLGCETIAASDLIKPTGADAAGLHQSARDGAINLAGAPLG